VVAAFVSGMVAAFYCFDDARPIPDPRKRRVPIFLSPRSWIGLTNTDFSVSIPEDRMNREKKKL